MSSGKGSRRRRSKSPATPQNFQSPNHNTSLCSNMEYEEAALLEEDVLVVEVMESKIAGVANNSNGVRINPPDPRPPFQLMAGSLDEAVNSILLDEARDHITISPNPPPPPAQIPIAPSTQPSRPLLNPMPGSSSMAAQPRNNAQVTINILRATHPQDLLDSQLMTTFCDLLEERMDNYNEMNPNNTVRVTGIRRMERQGTVAVTVENQQAANWILDQVRQITLLHDGAEIRLRSELATNNPKRVRFSVKTRNRSISERQFFRRFLIQNRGLVIDSWRIQNTTQIGGTNDMLVFITMSEEEANILQNQFNNRLVFGMSGTVTFRNLDAMGNGENRGTKEIGYRE